MRSWSTWCGPGSAAARRSPPEPLAHGRRRSPGARSGPRPALAGRRARPGPRAAPVSTAIASPVAPLGGANSAGGAAGHGMAVDDVRSALAAARRWTGRGTDQAQSSAGAGRITRSSVSSHSTTRGHVVSNGSFRVRQCRGGLLRGRCVGRTSLVQQPRRLRRVVALVDTGADPCLLGELERRLEHVHEQARPPSNRRASASALGMPSRRPYPTSQRTTAPFFCSTQAWSFFRYGLDRVSSMPCSLQKPINTSFRKLAAVVGVALPQRKREGAAEPIHRVDHRTCFPHEQRYAFRPAAGDIGQHQRPDEAAGHRRSTVRDQVGLDEARRRILPRTRSPPARRRRR